MILLKNLLLEVFRKDYAVYCEKKYIFSVTKNTKAGSHAANELPWRITVLSPDKTKVKKTHYPISEAELEYFNLAVGKNQFIDLNGSDQERIPVRIREKLLNDLDIDVIDINPI